MKKLLCIMLTLMIGIILTACTIKPEDSIRAFEEIPGDNIEAIESGFDYTSDLVKEDDTHYSLYLSGNATTGYLWEAQEPTGDALSSSVEHYSADNNLTGANGVYQFDITVNPESDDETCDIEYRYRRTWEDNEGIAKCIIRYTKKADKLEIVR